MLSLSGLSGMGGVVGSDQNPNLTLLLLADGTFFLLEGGDYLVV